MNSPGPGRALLLLGLAAGLRAALVPTQPPEWSVLIEPVALVLEELAGEEFRLLPGVGPVLAERLEAARLAAGGRLDPDGAAGVSGIGPTLLARWAALERARSPPR